MLGKKTGYSPLNAENNKGVNNDVMFAYVHKKINILLSVLSIFFFLFYDFNLNTQDFVYLEFVMYQLGLHRNLQVFAKCNVHVYSCFIFRHVQAFFLLSK